MTPRQMYKELSRLTRIQGADGKDLLSSQRFTREEMAELASGIMCLLEKLDASRARHDFGRAYQQFRARTPRVNNVDGSAEQEDPIPGRRRAISGEPPQGRHGISAFIEEARRAPTERPVDVDMLDAFMYGQSVASLTTDDLTGTEISMEDPAVRIRAMQNYVQASTPLTEEHLQAAMRILRRHNENP